MVSFIDSTDVTAPGDTALSFVYGIGGNFLLVLLQSLSRHQYHWRCL